MQESDEIIRNAASEFRTYLRGGEFVQYIRRLQVKPPKRRLLAWIRYLRSHIPAREGFLALSSVGEIVIGIVLMRNTILSCKNSAGPALVLGSFDFSVAGFEELWQISTKIHSLAESSDSPFREAVQRIFEDDQYIRFRRRALPTCVGSFPHVMLFDEVMRADDFLETDVEGTSVTTPFVVMFATRTNDLPTISAVVPRHISMPVLRYLAEKNRRLSGSKPDLREGGLYCSTNKQGGFSAFKILKLDDKGVHVRLYSNRFSERPKNFEESELFLAGMDRKADASLGIGHIPLSRASFDAWKVYFVQQSKVSEDELEGYRIWQDGGQYW